MVMFYLNGFGNELIRVGMREIEKEMQIVK